MPETRSEQEEALGRLVDIFDALGIEYLVTGSIAASVYVDYRATRDIDVVIKPRPDIRNALKKVLDEDFLVDGDLVDEALDEGTMFNVLSPASFSKIDVIIRNPRLDADEVFARRRLIELAGRDVSIISPEDLVVAKLRWARDTHSDLQLRDIHMLLELPDLDHTYVERRVADLGLRPLLEEARDERHAP